MWESGQIPHPDSLPCKDCGHVSDGTKRGKHHYDHYLGYDAEHHLNVEVRCIPCHKKIEQIRSLDINDTEEVF